MKEILSFSLVIWILTDRIKPVWQQAKYKSYITSCFVLVLGLLVSFLYGLDLLTALEITEQKTALGAIFSGIAIMGGSSCINELIERINNPFDLDIKEG